MAPPATDSLNGNGNGVTHRGPGAAALAAGVNSAVPSLGKHKKRAPTAVPPFSVADIRKAIPAHCFERSLVTSFRYLLVDAAAVAVLFYLSTYINTTISDERFGSTYGWLLRHVVWTAYWCLQGSIMTGLWVIGHECGHGGFADSETVNDVVGLIVHSLLLVPYFSWKISHRRHHSNTGNIDRDEVFVPEIRAHPGHSIVAGDAAKAGAADEEDGEEGRSMVFTFQSLQRSAYLVIRIFLMLTVGWPLYLFMNATGHQQYPKNVTVNHFSPSSPIFTTDRERKQVMISDIALVVVVAGLVRLVYVFGFSTVFYTFGVPYLITNAFLVLITFLQHTDTTLPHYSGDEWDWLRGALATIDRDYGILNYFHHHISDTHVAHHLFSFMPHYHAEEATAAIKPLLGEYYRSDRTPVPVALWRSFARCTFVSPDVGSTTPAEKGTMWFQKGQYM